jgi:uncharacterized membrane protein YdjX (TVP38/TMEM64 family)
MRQFWFFTIAVLFILLVIFLVFEQFDLPIFQELDSLMHTQSISVALIGIGLLLLDVLLPVPASLIMIASGTIFGFPIGTLLSLIGGVGAALTSFMIGKQSRGWVVEHFIPPEQMAAANRMFAKWGMVAIIVTRPIPLLAETTAIVAGASQMNYKQMLIAALAGYLPVAALYALAGSMAVGFDSTVWSFGLVMVIASLCWLLRERLSALLTDQARMIP